MPHILKTEALCLRVRNWRESSKIVTILTPDLGIIGGIARGARRPKNRFGASLDLFAYSRVTLYTRETRDLCTISEAELIHSYNGIALDYQRYILCGEIVRFVINALLHRNPEPRIFELLKKTFEVLSEKEKVSTDYSGFKGGVILKACSFLGFRPHLEVCAICRNPWDKEKGVGFDITRGGVVCSMCESTKKIPITFEELLTLNELLHTPGRELIGKRLPPSLLKLITEYANFYLGIPRSSPSPTSNHLK